MSCLEHANRLSHLTPEPEPAEATTRAQQTAWPGDAVLADDDGVVCVPRERVGEALIAGRARLDKEEATRRAFRDGELGLDRYGLRATLAELGVEYVKAAELAERQR